jgi:hypothetical protein
MADDYAAIYGDDRLKREDLIHKWDGNADLTVLLRQQISKINKAIKDELRDEIMLPFYQIIPVKKYASSRYGVRVEKNKIKII